MTLGSLFDGAWACLMQMLPSTKCGGMEWLSRASYMFLKA